MRRIFILSVLFTVGMSMSFGQATYKHLKEVPAARSWQVDFSADDDLINVSALVNHSAAPEVQTTASLAKKKVDDLRAKSPQNKTKSDIYSSEIGDIAPVLSNNFNGHPTGMRGVPNDNTLAVSNAGIVVSAVNTSVSILDSDGNLLKRRSLASITSGQLGFLDRYYDPKVLYDPIADRFILVFLEGSNSDDTRIIVGFTTTNDPTSTWNFYQINGRPLGGTTWSDYPIIAHNKEDLFITVNLLNDNMSWQEGFVQSFIWQVPKEDGYNGDSLAPNLFYDIEYNGKALWSICPVQPAKDFDQTDMYFLSVRPGDSSNDTVFLHHIDNTASSGMAQHSLDVLTSDLKYGVPPSAVQPLEGFKLQTNDTRVLSATLYQGDIHYVQTTVIPTGIRSGIYHGVIKDVATDPNVTARYISHSDMDLAYPSITFSGVENESLNSMLITFSHSGPEHYPGTSVVFHNGVGGLPGIYSDILIVKHGDSVINTFLADSIERWGDYTDIQREYDEPGVVWLAGSYGDDIARNNIWIARIVSQNDIKIVDKIITYPNPTSGALHIAANFEKEEKVDLQIIDAQGKVVKSLNDQRVVPGAYELLIHTDGLSFGIYFLVIKDESGAILHRERIVVDITNQ